MSSRHTEPNEKDFGKYKGYASTNEGGRLSVDAYGDTAEHAQNRAIAKLQRQYAEREAKRAQEKTRNVSR